ncbi:MAG: spore cortex-lytic enzyme [Eubacteriales bacterium]|nr:spore cortex-lytic enzyme [Clostridiales bacterium]MDY3285227.1 spore cortex-lytic enzyme [Eubacteriales bacterium]MDY5014619.1 spore cortex-lytic enzyme [Eubacteriales bacterium]
MHRDFRRCAQIAALFLANIVLILAITAAPAHAATYSYGSSGATVRTIQEKLSGWGYYSGAVDGIYGSRTRDAVMAFQRKNGLAVDGIAGPATLRAIGISGGSSGGSASRDENSYLLARIISAEARGEPYEGQVAVGAVVMNRVRHPSFPNTIAGVVYQSGAFTAVTDGQFDQPIADSAYRAAADALNGWDPSGGAIYYYNPAKTSNAWIRTREVIKTIGSHIFAK